MSKTFREILVAGLEGQSEEDRLSLLLGTFHAEVTDRALNASKAVNPEKPLVDRLLAVRDAARGTARLGTVVTLIFNEVIGRDPSNEEILTSLHVHDERCKVPAE